MIKFRKDFNCCKNVNCNNFGVLNSQDYIYKSRRLGYLSIECKACGSNPPWINNRLVNKIFKEKFDFQFGRNSTGCPSCYKYFFVTEKTDSKLHGFTSAGTQRKKCNQCNSVFTPKKYKNIDALKLVLSSINFQNDIRESIKSTGLPPRLYYFYLNKLALIFSNFSRISEERAVTRKYLALYSEGKVLHLEHQRGFYTLITAEADSGYILLQSNNITQQSLSKKDIYCAHTNTIITDPDTDNIENILIDHYRQNLKRKHFEQLLVGELKPITKCHLIYPDKLVYIHFQLLRAFTKKAQQYTHFIQHESCLRAATLMAAYADIKKANADVYYFLAAAPSADALQGKEIGWWKDKWFSNEQGAYCPITSQLPRAGEITLPDGATINLFYAYLNKSINKSINSMNVIDNLSEIHRVIFNYCELKDQRTRAQYFAVADKAYTPLSLLDDALKMIMSG